MDRDPLAQAIVVVTLMTLAALVIASGIIGVILTIERSC